MCLLANTQFPFCARMMGSTLQANLQRTSTFADRCGLTTSQITRTCANCSEIFSIGKVTLTITFLIGQSKSKSNGCEVTVPRDEAVAAEQPAPENRRHLQSEVVLQEQIECEVHQVEVRQPVAVQNEAETVGPHPVGSMKEEPVYQATTNLTSGKGTGTQTARNKPPRFGQRQTNKSGSVVLSPSLSFHHYHYHYHYQPIHLNYHHHHPSTSQRRCLV